MAGGLVGLLDDVATIAKTAAASIDDIGIAAGKAGTKAAGVIVDDTAVTPTYMEGLSPARELPIIRKIATGSLRNKLLIILPVALLLSSILPTLVEVILVGGGSFLAYEGAHKVLHRTGDTDAEPAVIQGPDAEAKVVSSAIRTDLILSAEVMVISLKEVLHEPFATRAAVLVLVALGITVLVYGVVALIVKIDDVGLKLYERSSGTTKRIGQLLVVGAPKLLAVLSVVGTAAMLWVGGHIMIASAAELGWHLPYDLVHDLEGLVSWSGWLGGVTRWLLNTLASAFVGIVVGLTINGVLRLLPITSSTSH